MIKVKDGYAKLIGTTTTGSASHLLLSNGGVKAVSDFAAASALDNYVTLNTVLTITATKTFSGGAVVSGTNASPLIVDTTYTNENGICVKTNGTSKTWIGYTSGAGAYLYTYTGPHKIGISDAGVGFIDSNTILHSGNYTGTLDGRYVNVTGDTMTGNLAIKSGNSLLTVYPTGTGNYCGIVGNMSTSSSGTTTHGLVFNASSCDSYGGKNSLTLFNNRGYNFYSASSHSFSGPITITYNSYPGLTIYDNTTSGESSIYIKNDTAGWALGVNTWGVGEGSFGLGLYSGTGGSNCRLSIDNNGKVRIGTTSGNEVLNLGGWLGTVGNTGWYSVTHKGGWYMIDGSYVRTYNNVRVHTGSLLRDAFNSAGGYYSSWNNSVGNDWTSILNPANAVFSKDNLYVNHGTALPMMTWANTVNSYGYVTRYSIGSVRPSNDAWGRLRLCVGNNDGGTSCGCYMDLDGDGAISTNASIYAAHFYENSDIRLKTNIENINNSDNIPLLKSFDWKDSNIRSYGLIAQELEEQGYSELVSEGDEGKKTVNYSAALSLIVGKLQVKIQEIEKENKELRDELNNLKTNKLWQS